MAQRRQQAVRDISDALLEELQGVKDLEEEKRRALISTPRFHELTDEVARRSQRVFDLANEEDEVSDSFDEPQQIATEDVPPSGPS